MKKIVFCFLVTLLTSSAFAGNTCRVCGNISANYGGIGYQGFFSILNQNDQTVQSVVARNDGSMACADVKCGEIVSIWFTPFYSGLTKISDYGQCGFAGNGGMINVNNTFNTNVPSHYDLECLKTKK